MDTTAIETADERFFLRTVQPPVGNEILFTEASVIEISSTEAGTQFFTFSKPFKFKKNGRVVIKNIRDIHWSLNELVNELRHYNPKLSSRHWRFKDEFELIEEEHGRPGDRK